MLNWGLLLIVPVLIATITMLWFKGKVTIGEFAIQVGVSALFVAAGLGIAYHGATEDTEIWNGQILKKYSRHVSCEHSYECNCYYEEECSGSGKSRSCEEVRHCSICYEHPYDVDWTVFASTGENVDIDRVDRQGLQMPPRWGHAYVGEPYSSEHTFTNYILSNPDSVLLGSRGDIKKWQRLIPAYPAKIYDYYYHDPVINMGVPHVDMGTWNWLIRNVNKELGPLKQVNVIVILVPTVNHDYLLALRDAWKGGKKNDVDVVLGSEDGHELGLVDVMSWTPNGDFKADLRGAIEDVGTLDRRDDIQQLILSTTKREFVRIHMHDMKYLVRAFQPSRTAMWWIFILSSLVAAGMAVYSVMDEWDDDHPLSEIMDEYN